MTEPLSAECAGAVVGGLPFPLIVLDRDGKPVWCNPACEQILGASLLQRIRTYRHEGDSQNPLHAILAGTGSFSWINGAGLRTRFTIVSFPLPQPHGGFARMLVEAAPRPDERHVLTDEATGLLNLRGLMLALEPQVARSRRYGRQISIISMSISCSTGLPSAAFSETARAIKDQIRWADLVGCDAGRTLILALPETAEDAAQTLATKLVALAEQLAARYAPQDDTMIRCGVASWGRDDNAATLLKRAEQAMGGTPSAADRRTATL